MRTADLHLEPNEASDLTPLLDAAACARQGWDAAFATVLDEAPAEAAIAVLGHAAGAPPDAGWEVRRLEVRKAGKAAGKTEDAEACTRREGVLYVLGSQFGSKDGPLEGSRSWAARVREDEVAAWLEGGKKPKIEIGRLRFRLHRAVNDALARAGTELLALGPVTRSTYIDATIRRGARKGKPWDGRITSADQPINVEAAEFRADGRLLLGLRHPVSAAGRPVLVELDEVEALFDEDAELRCANVWELEGIGSEAEPVGLRALHADGPDRFHAVVGNLDSVGKSAAVLADHPEGAAAESTHVRFELPAVASGGLVPCETVHRFDGLKRVEGLAFADGRAHYVIDRDGHIGLATLVLG